jgi:hypothetical protein
VTAGPDIPPGPRKLPVGAKLLIGCVATLALGLLGMAVVVGVGGFAVKRGIDAVVDYAEDQREATALLDRLERDYRFQPPSDGVVSPVLRDRFASATERAWTEISGWATEVREVEARGAARPGRRPTLGDAVTVIRSADGAARSRLVLARALSAERMSLAEYLWTGQTLQHDGQGRLASTRVEAADAALVLDLAAAWGQAERVR